MLGLRNQLGNDGESSWERGRRRGVKTLSMQMPNGLTCNRQWPPACMRGLKVIDELSSEEEPMSSSVEVKGETER